VIEVFFKMKKKDPWPGFWTIKCPEFFMDLDSSSFSLKLDESLILNFLAFSFNQSQKKEKNFSPQFFQKGFIAIVNLSAIFLLPLITPQLSK